jgi:hypothetical protein
MERRGTPTVLTPTLKKAGACVATIVTLLGTSSGAVLASDATPAATSPQPAAPAPSQTVRLGSSGFRVLQVQYVLKSLGYSLVVDGHFGRKTDAAVRGFQKSRSLRVDGIVGPTTAAALGLTPTTGAAAPAPVTPAPAPTAALAPGGFRHPNAAVERWHGAALAAGWTEDEWPRLSCIIERESKGDPAAKNRSSSATGLLQIMWDVHSRWIGGASAQLLDGPTNLRLGRQLFERSGGWGPWKSTVGGC